MLYRPFIKIIFKHDMPLRENRVLYTSSEIFIHPNPVRIQKQIQYLRYFKQTQQQLQHGV